MGRNNVVKFSLVLSVALVIGVTTPHFDPEAKRAAQYRSSDYQRFLAENMGVVPPYIILGDTELNRECHWAP